MAQIPQVIDIDGNGYQLYGDFPFVASKRITFDGGTTGAIGDDGGALDPFTIFAVTGDVQVMVIGVCKTTLVGAATLEVGVAGATAALLAQLADATTLAVNEAWAADGTVSLAEAVTRRVHVIGGGLDIIGTVGTADITAGVIDFYCFWRPLSTDGNVSPS